MTLYFAYGSNMSRAPMRKRCPTARPAGRAMLCGYRFVIMANGYASVVPAAGENVHGLLWKVGPRDLAALDAYEDVAGGLYRKVTLPVLKDGETVEALVYIGCEKREGRARADYMALVVAAAADCGLPEDYVARLARFAPGTMR
ncbi:MAG: gamma-glutamylcyclotransferase family protein [Pseudomonadota bacterium]